MKNTLKNYVLGLAALSLLLTGATAFIPAVSVSAAATKDCSGVRAFLTLPAWYRGLSTNNATGGCDIMSPDSNNLAGFIWHIVLNIIEIGLQLVGYLAFFFILYGGFQFLTSSGDASQAQKSRQTIFNATIGLAISFASIGIVNLVVGIIT